VFLHYSWIVVALIEINTRSRAYSSIVWNAAEYVALFGIVLLHEFGHSLACRQVGGKADTIILWPLGGVAFVAPPPRPGATLWSLAAGPLVNVILAPCLFAVLATGSFLHSPVSMPDAYALLRAICYINLVLLVFNLLPIYPLDGGQILRCLLWFIFGRARSLTIAAVIGFLGVAGLMALAIYSGSVWLGIMGVFILLNCWRGLLQARMLARVARLPRRAGFACRECAEPPPIGAFWRCPACLKPFDTFATQATCPNCGVQFPVTQCLNCGSSRPFIEWVVQPPVLSPSQ
jgi:Zn-dependent protease